MSNKEKRLSLNKETLRQLDEKDLQQAAGGTMDFGLLRIINGWFDDLFGGLYKEPANNYVRAGGEPTMPTQRTGTKTQ